MAPDYLCTKLSACSSIHDREIRIKNDLHIPIFKTCAGQRTFKYRATKLWNDQDSNFKNITSFNIFKKHFKQQMLLDIVS
jgi:hypothetical protein